MFTPKQERPAVLKNGCPSEVFECSCHACCLEDSAEDDQMRVKTKEMAGMVYNMTNCAVITKEIRQVAIKPFFVLPDTNLAKLAVGFSMYRGLYPGLFEHIRNEDFIGRSDDEFELLFTMVKSICVCVYSTIMFGFPNNVLVSDTEMVPFTSIMLTKLLDDTCE